MAHSQDCRETISHPPLVSIICMIIGLISHTRSRSFTLSAILTAPRVAPSLIEEKLALLCRGLIILRNVLGPQARKRETRGRRLQNFIVCHAEINNKTDLIPYDLYNIFLPQGSTISCRAQVCVCICVRVYELCVFLSSLYYRVRVYSMLFAYSLFFFYIYSTLTRASSRQPSISLPYIYSICKNIQVKCYIVVSTVKKFYTFSLEYGMQSDRPQSDLRRSKANPNPRTQVKRHRNSASSIGHAACEEDV